MSDAAIIDFSLEAIRVRSARRAKVMITHQAGSYEDAEAWDLAFWQSKSPAERLQAYMAIREDVEKVERARDGLRT